MVLAGKDIGKQIRDIADPIAKALCLEVNDVSCQGRKGGTLVRVIIDKAEGVSIRDCEQFHNSLSRALDVADPISHTYRLEVSSPGLDRPLRSQDDYQRSVGKLLYVKVFEPVQGQWVQRGRLVQVDNAGIVLQPVTSRREGPVEIAWDLIAVARCEVEF
ncbi:MAG: ribosome maturation factor RimP [Nitrospirales bacterium]|nr:ribosome maturation factor RimP [Nitrospirales bacterium]